MLTNYTIYCRYPVLQKYNEMVDFILRKWTYLEREMVSKIGKVRYEHISKIRGEEARNHDFFRAGEVWAKKGTMLLIHTNKIVICSCKDLLFWPFKLLKYAEIDTKCIYFQLRTDAKI